MLAGENVFREIQKPDTVIYTIGLLSEESKKSAQAREAALEKFPKLQVDWLTFRRTSRDVHNILRASCA